MTYFSFISAPNLFFERNLSRRPQRIQKRIPVCNIKIDPESERIARTLTLPPRIALTREKNKNQDLYDSLLEIYEYVELHELPCVETVPGEDAEELPKLLAQNQLDWIVITSPEAASVFTKAWKAASYPSLGKIAAVGRATGEKLRAFGLDISFIPSKTNGETLVKEFPPCDECQTVIYPASKKAATTIVDGLSRKGYKVTRLNTYSTETRKFTDMEKTFAIDTDIVTFAAPSAVKGWVSNVGVNKDLTVACIGETSATAAKKAGFVNVHYPDKPGMEGWLSAISEGLKLFVPGEKDRKMDSR